jgi:hypothetical protein
MKHFFDCDQLFNSETNKNQLWQNVDEERARSRF